MAGDVSRAVGRRAWGRAAWRLGVALILLASTGCATVASAPAPLRAERRTAAEPETAVEFGEIRVELPGPEWRRDTRETSRLDIRRGPPGQQRQTISVWTVEVPRELRGLSLHEHATRFFEAERSETPPGGGRWEGFVQSHRVVGGRLHPVMVARVVYPERRLVAERLFLLYFPNDWGVRRRFYVVLWLDFHGAGERARPLGELDAVVASLRLQPLAR